MLFKIAIEHIFLIASKLFALIFIPSLLSHSFPCQFDATEKHDLEAAFHLAIILAMFNGVSSHHYFGKCLHALTRRTLSVGYESLGIQHVGVTSGI